MTSVVPYFGYRDAAAAIDWLERAFGFERSQDRDGTGSVVHAEMTLSGGVIMLGTGEGPAHDPDPSGDASPTGHGIYVVVDDVEAHHERARAAGARIVYPPEQTEFGTRRYRALDPEGYEWSFGSYRPEANGRA